MNAALVTLEGVPFGQTFFDSRPPQMLGGFRSILRKTKNVAKEGVGLAVSTVVDTALLPTHIILETGRVIDDAAVEPVSDFSVRKATDFGSGIYKTSGEVKDTVIDSISNTYDTVTDVTGAAFNIALGTTKARENNFVSEPDQSKLVVAKKAKGNVLLLLLGAGVAGYAAYKYL